MKRPNAIGETCDLESLVLFVMELEKYVNQLEEELLEMQEDHQSQMSLAWGIIEELKGEEK